MYKQLLIFNIPSVQYKGGREVTIGFEIAGVLLRFYQSGVARSTRKPQVPRNLT